MSWKGALACLSKDGLGVHVEEAARVFRTDRAFADGTRTNVR